MDRQPWCVGSGQQVSTGHNFGGRVGTCTSCGRADLAINKDGTLRYHVAYLLADEPRVTTGKAPAKATQPFPVFR